MLYTDELRLQIENSFGKKIVSKTDATNLKNSILINQKEYLSESTIRRFFNLVKTGVTSHTTLDIFSRYIGFSCYNEFCVFCEHQIKSVANSEIDDVIITELATKKSISIFEVNLFTNRIIQLIKNNDVEILETYFNSDSLFELIKANQSIADLFAQTLGPYFSIRSGLKKFALDKIMATKFFTPLILNHYVDVGNDDFEPYYKSLFRSGKTTEEIVFSGTILALNNILKDQWEDANFYYKKIKNNKHYSSLPLAGRIALIDWIFNDDFDALIECANNFSDQIVYFSIDIIPYFILKNRKDLLKIWFQKFPKMIRQNKSWVENDFITLIKIAKYFTEDNDEELNKLLDYKNNMMNSNTLFNLAIICLEKNTSR
ncbi:hypothetical protein [Flavobacterium sp.]|uniref:hypothetical protein n=1 Tax=Flavobacterium sp. TaxID=239 RepID=UPI00333E43C0